MGRKFEPGKSGNPAGKPKGTLSKKTKEIKEAYTNLIHGNIDGLMDMLNRVAIADPARALEILIKISPFVIPKKMEQDITIENPIKIQLPPNPNSVPDATADDETEETDQD